MVSIHIICRNNIYVVTISITYDNNIIDLNGDLEGMDISTGKRINMGDKDLVVVVSYYKTH